MVTVEGRSAEILEAAVREYISSGEPVSSALLYRRYDFGIKPAMIRLELNTLTDGGYLDQPYHSAGRVPSDRGYEFFALRVVETDEPGRGADHRLRALFEAHRWPEVVECFADTLGILGVLNPFRNEVYKEGLDHLVEHLAFHSRETLRDVIRDFEALDERVSTAREALTGDEPIHIFIGRSPVTRSRELAVIAGDCGTDGERAMLLAIGPKRMDYEKAARMFKALQKTKKHHGRAKK